MVLTTGVVRQSSSGGSVTNTLWPRLPKSAASDWFPAANIAAVAAEGGPLMRRPAVQHADVLAQRVASAGPARLLDGEYLFWRAADRCWGVAAPRRAALPLLDLIDRISAPSFLFSLCR